MKQPFDWEWLRMMVNICAAFALLALTIAVVAPVVIWIFTKLSQLLKI